MSDEQPTAQQSVQQPIQSSKRSIPIVKLFTTRNLSVVVSGIILIIALIKAKPDDIPKIIETLCGSNEFAVIGWAIAVILLVTSVVLVRIMMNIHNREIERLVQERDQLQAKLLQMLPQSNQNQK